MKNKKVNHSVIVETHAVNVHFQKERLTDGSHVYNIVLQEGNKPPTRLACVDCKHAAVLLGELRKCLDVIETFSQEVNR